MKELKEIKQTMTMLTIVWFLALLFSAVMFTLSLMYDAIVSLYISCVTGVLSGIGIFYTANIIVRIKNGIENDK